MSEKHPRKTGRGRAKKRPTSISEFDREFIADTFKPLAATDKARWERARKRENGEQGKEHPVTVHVDSKVLDNVDALAQKMGVSRECLITRGIKVMLAAAGDD